MEVSTEPVATYCPFLENVAARHGALCAVT